MIKKLKQKKGETLVETLVSMLIAVLSVGMLATAVLAATNINKQTREMDERYNSQLQEVEGLDENAHAEKAMLTITFSTSDGSAIYESTNTEVLLYGSDESAFLSYDYEPKGDMP